MVSLDVETKDLLRRLAAHRAGRRGRDAQALGHRLEAAVKKGQVMPGEFTVVDVNFLQRSINTAEFMSQVLSEIAQQAPSPVTQGVDAEAAKASAEAERLKQYRAAVANLGIGP